MQAIQLDCAVFCCQSLPNRSPIDTSRASVIMCSLEAENRLPESDSDLLRKGYLRRFPKTAKMPDPLADMNIKGMELGLFLCYR